MSYNMTNPKKVVMIAATHPRLERVCTNWAGMRKGLEDLDIPYEFITCRPTLNINEVVNAKPDLIVYGLRDVIINPAWREEIRQRCPHAKIVIWYGDYRDENTGQNSTDCSKTVDAMFISNDAQEEFYKKRWHVPSVHFLPLGCEPVAKPEFNKLFAFDFVFIGGQISGLYFKERAGFIQHCRDALNLKLINSFDPDTRAKIHDAMPTIYSSSKVTLDISHFTNVKDYTSNRFWIIPAFHGFALTKRFPGCTNFYPENTRAYFDTVEELKEKLSYYLKHDKERNEMIERAYQHSFTHKYKYRWRMMFEYLF